MALVSVIRHITLGDERVLKEIRSEVAHDPRFRARFEREHRVAARLGRHPNVVTVHHYGISPTGKPFAVLEFHPDGSLDGFKTRPDTPRRVGTILGVLAGAATALEYLDGGDDGQVYVHRDVKPQNILVGPRLRGGYPTGVLADFGLARAIDDFGMRTVGFWGTAAYSAPELWSGGSPSPASDVYALGMTVYYMFTGRFPFSEPPDRHGWAEVHLHAAPRPPVVADRRLRALGDLVTQSLRKDPDERPRAAEWRVALETAGLGFRARPLRNR